MTPSLRHLGALALLAAAPVAAQTVLTPGSPDLTAAAPQSFEYETRVAGTPPRHNGWFDYSETVDGDRLVIVSKLSRERTSLRPPDTTVVTWPGLAPVSRMSYGEEEVTRSAFAGGRVTGRHQLGNLDEPVDEAVPAGVFSDGMAIRIARSVPFRAGYEATFRTADFRGDLETQTVRVVRQEPAARADGSPTTAWIVEISTPGSPTTTYTVDAETRALLRRAYDFREGMTMEFAPPAAAPTGPMLRPGDPSLDTAWLRDGETATFALNLIEPMAMPGIGTSTVTRSVSGGVVTSIQTITVPSQGVNEAQTATADLATLRPLSQVDAGQQAVDLTFADGQVSGTKAGAPVSVALDAPVFDSSWSNEIAQSLPLAMGYTATAATYDATNGLSTVTFTVTGQTDVGGAPAWTVEAVSANGPATYVIDAATRRLVSMRISPQPGVTVEMTRQP